MSADRGEVRLLVEKLLEGGGKIPLETLLRVCVPVSRLRELVRKCGLSPKGGYRVDKAPAKVLSEILAEVRDAQVLDEICEVLVAAAVGARARNRTADAQDLQPVLQLREQELDTAQQELAKAREVAARLRDREGELGRLLREERENVARTRAELGSAQQQLDAIPKAPADPDRERRLRELERELDALREAGEEYRRLLALRASRIRDLQDQVAELAEQVPAGRRREAPPADPPEPGKRFHLPYFHPSFYKSLEGKDRRSVERALYAILLFCTEGPGYPGLEAKPIEGQRLWSLRASRKLRVYFDLREDGDVDVLCLVDREDQHTALRRLKER